MLFVKAFGIFTCITIACEVSYSLKSKSENSKKLLHTLLVNREKRNSQKEEFRDFLTELKRLLKKQAEEKKYDYLTKTGKEQTEETTQKTTNTESTKPQSNLETMTINEDLSMRMVDHHGKKTFKEADTKNPRTSKMAEALLEEDTHDYHPRPVWRKTVKGNKRTFLKGDNILWMNGIIPYKINENVDSICQQEIQAAIAVFHSKTCIRWEPYLGSGQDHVEFFMGGMSSSYVGNIEVSKYGRLYNLTSQPISIESSHCSLHVVLHEMAHTVGMTHEQSRSDRDQYVTVHWEHVLGGKDNLNLVKEETDNHNIPYDYSSLMHYSVFAFSKDGKKTIEYKNSDYEFLGLRENSLSFYDIEDITKAYKCSQKCPDKKCLNAGYVDHTCVCKCPEYLRGEQCEEVITSDCGGVVELFAENEKKSILSPNYPQSYSVGDTCVWLVKAPFGMKIELTSNDFDLPDGSSNQCYHWLEVRSNLIGQPGPLYCGDSLPVIETSLGSESHLLLLKFDSSFQFTKSGKGFNLIVTSKISPTQTDPNSFSSTSNSFCESHPNWCYNGGSCVISNDDVSCVCPDQFSGKFCEHDENVNQIASQTPVELGTYNCKPAITCSMKGLTSKYSWKVVDNFLTVIPRQGTKGDEAEMFIPFKIANRDMNMKFTFRCFNAGKSDVTLEVTRYIESAYYQYDESVYIGRCDDSGAAKDISIPIYPFFDEESTIFFKAKLQNDGDFNIAIESISIAEIHNMK
ncbi:blastula protease 10-like [Saccostrea cucullata]|uniref:blastula protease 10-like n=1 Tax=Saccostrea cuccullata TaxID=36930 RepID=UPI002ED6A015